MDRVGHAGRGDDLRAGIDFRGVKRIGIAVGQSETSLEQGIGARRAAQGPDLRNLRSAGGWLHVEYCRNQRARAGKGGVCEDTESDRLRI